MAIAMHSPLRSSKVFLFCPALCCQVLFGLIWPCLVPYGIVRSFVLIWSYMAMYCPAMSCTVQSTIVLFSPAWS